MEATKKLTGKSVKKWLGNNAIIVLMLWLYLTSTVLIMGNVFNQIMNETRKKYGSWKPPLPQP